MLHRMMFRGLIGEIASLGRVTMRYVRMVSPLFVGANLVVFCGFAMMMGRMLVVLGGLGVMLGSFMRHDVSLQ